MVQNFLIVRICQGPWKINLEKIQCLEEWLIKMHQKCKFKKITGQKSRLNRPVESQVKQVETFPLTEKFPCEGVHMQILGDSGGYRSK